MSKHMVEGTNFLILLESPSKKALRSMMPLIIRYLYQPTTKPKPVKFQVKTVNVFTRKAAYHYGWDWGPRLVTSGIWRPVRLISWDDFRISDMVLNQELNGDVARILAHLEIESSIENANALLQLQLDDDIIASTKVRLSKGKQDFNIPIKIDRPELWWPNGLGKQHLYNLQVKLQRKEVISTANQYIGIREIQLCRRRESTQFLFQSK